MTDIHRENIAHMLASMHLVLRQQDGQERDSGEYRHITNTSYVSLFYRSTLDDRYPQRKYCSHVGLDAPGITPAGRTGKRLGRIQTYHKYFLCFFVLQKYPG